MSKLENAVVWAVKIANDDTHGYAQDNRNGNPDYDCSSFIGTALNQAGFNIKKTSTTATLYNQLVACGFKTVNTGERERGDIYLTPNKHVVMCTDGYNIVHASINEKGGISGGKAGDQTGKEICVRSFYTPSYGWTYHLRYSDSSGGSAYPTYIEGNNYTLLANLKVRKDHSTSAGMVGYNGLTADGKRHDKDKNGCLDKGTVVTCKAVYVASDYVWLKCPSGWIAGYDRGTKEKFVG